MVSGIGKMFNGGKDILAIFHFSFPMFHLSGATSRFPRLIRPFKWKMENDKRKMTNKSQLSSDSLFPLKVLPHIPDHFRNLRR